MYECLEKDQHKALSNAARYDRQGTLETTIPPSLYLFQQRQKVDDVTVSFPSVADVPGFVGRNVFKEYNIGLVIFHRLGIEKKRRGSERSVDREDRYAAPCFHQRRARACSLTKAAVMSISDL